MLSRNVGDRGVIRLTTIDAVAGTAANDAFSFIGLGTFSGAGQLRYEIDTVNNQTIITASTDANLATAEFRVVLSGLHTLVADDLAL